MTSIRHKILKRIAPGLLWPRFVEIEGVQFRIRTAPCSFGTKRILTTEPDKYECSERQMCKHALTRGDHVLELGSSIGVLTAVIAKQIGPEGRLISIEADPEIVEYAREQVQSVFPGVQIIQGFAFPLYHPVPLKTAFRTTSGGSLGGRVTYESTEGSGDRRNVFIRDIEETYGFMPNAMVMDIEGAEQILTAYQPELPLHLGKLIIEFHPAIYGEDMMSQIIESIRNEGFEEQKVIENVYLFLRADLQSYKLNV